MTPAQDKAANALERALAKCRDAGLGVYCFDGNMLVCPQPEGAEHPGWDINVLEVISEIGRTMYVPGLSCDGGAGV